MNEKPVGGTPGERRRFVRAVCVCGRLRRRRQRIDGSRLVGGRRVRVGAIARSCVASLGCARAAASDDSSRPRVAALPLSNAILSAFAFCRQPHARGRRAVQELKLGIDEAGIELGRSNGRLFRLDGGCICKIAEG